MATNDITNSVFNINLYIKDNFKKVCNVSRDVENGKEYWIYTSIDESLMFSEHTSWIYFIVDGIEIVKVGETGARLGQRPSSVRADYFDQPITGTKTRLGRYRRNGDTDFYIRNSLVESVINNRVSIWAKQCNMLTTTEIVAGENVVVTFCPHKDLELRYLDHFVSSSGRLPRLNKLRK